MTLNLIGVARSRGGASVDLSSPPPIGDVAPNTGAFTTLSASGNLAVDTNVLFVDTANDRVGLRNAAPEALLHVTSPIGTIGIFERYGGVATLLFRRNGGTEGSPGATTAGLAGNFALGGHDGTAFVSAGNFFLARTQGTWSPSQRPFSIELATTELLTNTTRLFVAANGFVGLGNITALTGRFQIQSLTFTTTLTTLVTDAGVWTQTAIDAGTNDVVNTFIVGRQSTGTPAAGFGTGLLFQLESSTTIDQAAARIRTLWTTATHASRVANMVLSVWNIGVETDMVTITPTGVGIKGSPSHPFHVVDTSSQVAGRIGNITFNNSANGGAATGKGISSSSGIYIFNTNGSVSIRTAAAFGSEVERFTISDVGLLTVWDGGNIALGTTTGTKIGTATSQKLSLWNVAPDVQPTTAIAAATFVANSSGIADDTATWGGYTAGQIVAALKRIGALA